MQQTWSGTTEVAEYALVIVECIVGWEAFRAAGSAPPQEWAALGLTGQAGEYLLQPVQRC
jgi:hypothetical protein